MNEEIVRERVRFRGGGSLLAGELAYPAGRERRACLLLNPHPYMGGRMDNPLIERLAVRLAEKDTVTLRFDYAGVGESEGPSVNVAESMASFWETGNAPIDPGLLTDGLAARDWLGREAGMAMSIIGYSFGAFVASRIANSQVSAVVLISPTLGRHDYAGLIEITVPKLVIYGQDDFATSQAELEAWYDGLSEPKQLRCVQNGEHFFRGQESQVAEACVDFIEETCSMEVLTP